MRTAKLNLRHRLAGGYRVYMALVLGAVLTSGASCSGQTQTPTMSGSQISQRVQPPTQSIDSQMDGAGAAILSEKRLKALNTAQHNAMVADADKLLKLVAQLNEQINNSNAHSLTPGQLRMVAEIEKLAHSVRDKMRMTVRSAEVFDPNPIMPFVSR